MKKVIILVFLACFTIIGTYGQTQPGSSAYGHSHKKGTKIKKAKIHHSGSAHNDGHRKAINVRHKTTVRTIKDNDALSNTQQKDMVKEANTTHKVEMKRESLSHKKPGKK
jgi:ABC-type nickel/cobalt efflux system permease component RcnA